MKRSVQDGDFIIREYREDDFNGIARLWELTGMGNHERFGFTHLDGYDVYIMRDIEKL
jgi:hypothetical protein